MLRGTESLGERPRGRGEKEGMILQYRSLGLCETAVPGWPRNLYAVLKNFTAVVSAPKERLCNRKPAFGNKLLGISTGSGFGALKGFVRAARDKPKHAL